MFVVAVTARLGDCVTVFAHPEVWSHSGLSASARACHRPPHRIRDTPSPGLPVGRETEPAGPDRPVVVWRVAGPGPPVTLAGRAGLPSRSPQLCKFSPTLAGWRWGVGAGGATQVTRSDLSLVSLGNQWSKFSRKMEKIKLQISAK